MEWTQVEDVTALTDDELQGRLNRAGEQARLWARRFQGLLPEARRRGLPEKAGCSSIVDFAAKKGGTGWETVRSVLETDRVLEDKPALRRLLQSGQVAMGKLKVAAREATAETDRVWAERVATMTWEGVGELARQQRQDTGLSPEDEEARAMGYAPRLELPPDLDRSRVDLMVDPVTGERFLVMRDVLARSGRRTLSVSDTLAKLMDGFAEADPARCFQVVYVDQDRDLVITPTRWGMARVSEDEVALRASGDGPATLSVLREAAEAAARTATGRHLPAAVRRYVDARFGGFCAHPGCHRRGAVYHHVRRWALDRRHDPDGVVPLCRPHDELAHRGLIENELGRVLTWRSRLERPVADPDETARARVDEKVWQRRRREGPGGS